MPFPRFLIRLFAVALALVLPPAAFGQTGDELAAATRLANAGNVEGYYRLGRVFERGREVKRDLFEAARQYQRAADLGDAEAQFSLGLLLLGALPEAPRDERKAFESFAKAAAQGHAKAAHFLAMAYESGVGTPESPERAFEWYRRAAIAGHAGSLDAIARMYATGAGIQVNLPNAHAWNQVAIARGSAGAARYGEELEAQMSEPDIERANKLAKGLMRRYGAAPAAREP